MGELRERDGRFIYTRNEAVIEAYAWLILIAQGDHRRPSGARPAPTGRVSRADVRWRGAKWPSLRAGGPPVAG